MPRPMPYLKGRSRYTKGRSVVFSMGYVADLFYCMLLLYHVAVLLLLLFNFSYSILLC